MVPRAVQENRWQDRYLDWLTYSFTSVKEYTILVSKWNLGSSWHKVVAQLLKISPVLTWENVPVDGNVVADVMMQAFVKHGTMPTKIVKLGD